MEKFLSWLICGVIFPLIPLGVIYIHLYNGMSGDLPPLADLTKNGEAYLIVSSLCAISIGDLWGRPGPLSRAIGLLTVIVFGFSCYEFVDIWQIRVNNTNIDNGKILLESAFTFIGAIMLCGACTVLSEID
jgi:hypothetical protein